MAALPRCWRLGSDGVSLPPNGVPASAKNSGKELPNRIPVLLRLNEVLPDAKRERVERDQCGDRQHPTECNVAPGLDYQTGQRESESADHGGDRLSGRQIQSLPSRAGD